MTKQKQSCETEELESPTTVDTRVDIVLEVCCNPQNDDDISTLGHSYIPIQTCHVPSVEEIEDVTIDEIDEPRYVFTRVMFDCSFMKTRFELNVLSVFHFLLCRLRYLSHSTVSTFIRKWMH